MSGVAVPGAIARRASLVWMCSAAVLLGTGCSSSDDGPTARDVQLSGVEEIACSRYIFEGVLTEVGATNKDHLAPMTFTVTRWLKPRTNQTATVTVLATAPEYLGFKLEGTLLVTSYLRDDVAATVLPVSQIPAAERQQRDVQVAKSEDISCPVVWLNADFDTIEWRDDW
ncbi:hypothetical protein KV097_15485 [Mumia sp. zg.B17]|uniref:hypothetical protein n=1 Tax=Mumia sp. zg.B17 TaxID=2855446 RepID=UPI001C6F2178|nr:hypothetical protein [Mumia sp. zg.B17]MBW9207345.1 hypothetical protein [Mumia sp. zg.B17]